MKKFKKALFFYPSRMLKKLFPRDTGKLLTRDVKFKDKFKQTLLRLNFLSGKDVNKSVNDTLTFYEKKMKELKKEGFRNFK
jgi:hypothetical protein